MPDELQNQDSEQNSIPVSPQEPTADAPILPMDSEPAEVPSDAPEASRKGFSDENNNIPPSNSTLTEAENELKTEEKQAPNEPIPESVSGKTGGKTGSGTLFGLKSAGLKNWTSKCKHWTACDCSNPKPKSELKKFWRECGENKTLQL